MATNYDKIEVLLKALADKSRLQILDGIEHGSSNPGEMARKLGRHRSTIGKHLRVLLKAGIVEKVPSLTQAGQLSVRYKKRDSAVDLLKVIQEVAQES